MSCDICAKKNFILVKELDLSLKKNEYTIILNIQFDLERFAFLKVLEFIVSNFSVVRRMISTVFALMQIRHIMHRRSKDSHAMTYIRRLPSPSRFPSANAIADISGVARDYNIVYCSAFRSTWLHATYRGKSPMIVSQLECSTDARAFQPRRLLILQNLFLRVLSSGDIGSA